MQLPLESCSNKSIVVNSEFPGMVFLSQLETKLGGEFLFCMIISELSSGNISVVLMVEVQSVAKEAQISIVEIF